MGRGRGSRGCPSVQWDSTETLEIIGVGEAKRVRRERRLRSGSEKRFQISIRASKATVVHFGKGLHETHVGAADQNGVDGGALVISRRNVL